MLLLVLGSILAMWLRGTAPLNIYLWAFLPSVLDLILISSGEHMLRDGDIVGGFALLWSGHFVLLGIIGVVYTKVARN